MSPDIEEKVNKFLQNLVLYVETSIESAMRDSDDSGMGRFERDMRDDFESLIKEISEKT